MKLTRCSNRHFYDADKFGACPHCGVAPEGGQSGVTPPTSTSGSSKSRSRSRTGKSKSGESDGGMVTVLEPKPPSHAFCEKCGTPHVAGDIYCGGCGECTKKGREAKPPETKPVPPGATIEPESGSTPQFPESAPVLHHGGSGGAPIYVAHRTEPEAVDVIQGAQEEKKGSLQTQVEAVTSHATEDVKTVAIYEFAEEEPVVGWLVCVGGEYKGQSFNLKAGRNFIGRALTMDVPLAKDTSVSRNRHASITYDPQNHGFFIQPGESSGLTYLNEELLLAHQSLAAYDKVKLGNSIFVFAPFCGEQFTWDDYID